MKKYLLVLAACALTTACAEYCEDYVRPEPQVIHECGCQQAPACGCQKALACGCQKESPCGCHHHKKTPCGCSAMVVPTPMAPMTTPIVLPAPQPKTVVVVVPAKRRAQVVVPEIIYPEK